MELFDEDQPDFTLPTITTKNSLQIQYVNNLLEQLKRNADVASYKAIERQTWRNFDCILHFLGQHDWREIDLM